MPHRSRRSVEIGGASVDLEGAAHAHRRMRQGHSASPDGGNGPQRGGDLRYDLEISFEEAAHGSETTIQIPRQENCETCSGSGAAPGSSPTVCSQCRGQGQVRFQQGFFSIAKTCGHCNGQGTIIANPCPSCEGSGVQRRTHQLNIKVPPGVDSGSRLKLRGEGDVLGVRQSGLPGYRIARPGVHAQLIAQARDEALRIMKDNPRLKGERGQALRCLLYLFERDEALPLIGAG